MAESRRPWMLWPRQALVGLVRVYRLLLSPWLGNSCRFEPTCSVYAIEALQRHGAAVGTVLTTGRLLRCHPWCTPGHDPVPERPFRLFTDLLSAPNTAPNTAATTAPVSTRSTPPSPRSNQKKPSP